MRRIFLAALLLGVAVPGDVQAGGNPCDESSEVVMNTLRMALIVGVNPDGTTRVEHSTILEVCNAGHGAIVAVVE